MKAKEQAVLKKIEAKCVIFYDGDCALCNRIVGFVLERDHGDLFRFASLQSDFARQLLPEPYTQNLSTMVLRKPDRALLFRSDAALTILASLSLPYRLLGSLFCLVPRSIRERAYDLLAKYRQGMPVSCRIPANEKRLRIEERTIQSSF